MTAAAVVVPDDGMARHRTVLVLVLGDLFLLAVNAAVPAGGTATSIDPSVFRANDTLLGTPISCTEAQKACLRYNRLLDIASGKCYRVGSRGPCLDTVFLLDRQQFETAGRLVGVCADPGRCPGHGFRMAYNGQCYSSKEVFGTFCDVTRGTSGWPYFFGGYECVCEGLGCPTSSYIRQPNEPEKCRFPNFRKDLTTNFLPRLPKVDLECSPAQSRCFANGEVSFGAGGQCYKLREQGPCPQGHYLVLDKQHAFSNKKVTIRCELLERCPVGTKFVTYLRRCVNETKIDNMLCPDLDTFTDVFGETVCRFKEEFYEVILKSPGEGFCNIRYYVTLAEIPELPKPKCISLDPLDCLALDEADPDLLMSSLGESLNL